MNHLEALTAEWLAYNGYFTRSTINVGKRPQGGWDGELDVVGFHPSRGHFIHVECSTDAWAWKKRQETFKRKFSRGQKHAAFKDRLEVNNGPSLDERSQAGRNRLANKRVEDETKAP